MNKDSKNKLINLPIRSSAKRKEDISKNHFEESISPWLLTRWESHDYGIDAIIEITRPLAGTTDDIVTGKRFSVQLKASRSPLRKNGNYSLRIGTEKVRYWLSSIEPVLLARYDINNNVFNYIWIDDSLLNFLNNKRPNWMSQKNVIIEVPSKNHINEKALSELENYVLKWKRLSKYVIKPGKFFKLREEITHIIEETSSIIDLFKIEDIMNDLAELKNNTKNAIYSVAITGPSRAGKSTLINAIMECDISPIGILPTTGIPIAIIPGNRNIAEIYFKDGRKEVGAANSVFLKRFVSQEDNPNNCKNVKSVTVKLVNQKLERGISFYDIPGLDDPDENVRSVVTSTLHSVNAIVYVVDISPAKEGGFSLTKQIIEDLNELGLKMDRMFLVFNKADRLSKKRKQDVELYITSTLEKFGINELLPEPPFFLNAKKDFQQRCLQKTKAKKTKDSISLLENALWEYLLSKNKTGIYLLLNNLITLRNKIDDFVTILNTRLIAFEKRGALLNQINDIRRQLSSLQRDIESKKNEIMYEISISIKERRNTILSYLKRHLSKIPINQGVPDKKVIESFLKKEAMSATADIQENINAKLSSLYFEINNWVDKKLSQIRMEIEKDSSQSDYIIPTLKDIRIPIPLDFSEALGPTLLGGILAGIAGLFIGPFAAIFLLIGGSIVGFFAGIFLTAEDRRNRQIRSIMKKANKTYDKIFNKINEYAMNHINQACNIINQRVNDRVNIFLNMVTHQINELGEPLTNQEKDNFREVSQKIEQLKNNINSYISTITEYVA